MRWLALFICLMTTSAQAVNLIGHRFTDSYRYSLLEDAFTEKFPAKNVFTASYAHVHAPFYYTDSEVNAVDEDIINYNNVLTFGYSHYWSERLVFGFDLAAVQNKVLEESYTSLADSVVRAKYRLWDFVSINPQITLPTGKKENFTTARSVTGSVSLLAEGHWAGWHLLGGLGYGHAPRSHYRELDYRNLALVQLGLSLDVTEKWNVNAEVIRNFTIESDERQDEGDYYLTAKHKTGESYALYAGGGLAGTDEVERNNYTVFAGIKWHDGAEEKPVPQAQPQPVKPAPPVAVAPPKNREDEKRFGRLVATENIYFCNGRTEITASEQKKVEKFIALYKSVGDKVTRIVLEGYASRVGNVQKNFVLGQGRSQNVAAMLVENGVPPAKIVTVSYGDQSVQLAEEWQNRKVQFRVYQQ